MARLILALMLIAALALAAAGVMTLLRSLSPAAALPRPAAKVDPMPDILRNVAYVLLLILLVGVATGWLGA